MRPYVLISRCWTGVKSQQIGLYGEGGVKSTRGGSHHHVGLPHVEPGKMVVNGSRQPGAADVIITDFPAVVPEGPGARREATSGTPDRSGR
ncbi:MAG: hypothetical protein NTNFB02_20770 [Nitrospira sp.]